MLLNTRIYTYIKVFFFCSSSLSTVFIYIYIAFEAKPGLKGEFRAGRVVRDRQVVDRYCDPTGAA